MVVRLESSIILMGSAMKALQREAQTEFGSMPASTGFLAGSRKSWVVLILMFVVWLLRSAVQHSPSSFHKALAIYRGHHSCMLTDDAIHAC